MVKRNKFGRKNLDRGTIARPLKNNFKHFYVLLRLEPCQMDMIPLILPPPT